MARQYNARACKACATLFIPTGCRQPWCNECAEFRYSYKIHLQSLLRTHKRGGKAGSGSGGHNESGCHSQKYREWFLLDVYRAQDGRCAVCWDEVELGPEFLLHHKDHNREHNVRDNFDGVCKRCHQIEHECWLNFRKA